MSNIVRFERPPLTVHVGTLRVYPKAGKVAAIAAEMYRRGWKLQEMETYPAAALVFVR